MFVCRQTLSGRDCNRISSEISVITKLTLAEVISCVILCYASEINFTFIFKSLFLVKKPCFLEKIFICTFLSIVIIQIYNAQITLYLSKQIFPVSLLFCNDTHNEGNINSVCVFASRLKEKKGLFFNW